MIPNTFIEYAATTQSISLRTGCMCNPGGAAALLGVQDDMKHLYPGVTLKDFEQIVGRELGVVRISLGLASSFEDVWKVVRFAATIANEKSRQALWDRWMDNSAIGQAVWPFFLLVLVISGSTTHFYWRILLYVLVTSVVSISVKNYFVLYSFMHYIASN